MKNTRTIIFVLLSISTTLVLGQNATIPPTEASNVYSLSTISADTLSQESNATDSKPVNQIGIIHLQSFYSNGINTMGNTSLQYLRKSKDLKWTFIGRANLRTRGGEESLKFDLETYVKHGTKHYSFAGVSVSDKKMFPEFEAFYSLYSSLNHGWELETGAKYLSATEFSLFTPIVGTSKEFGNNRVTIRQFFTFTENSMYYANTAMWKHFFNEKRDNVSFMTGFGNAPDSKNIDYNTEFISNKSFFIGLGGEKHFKQFTTSLSTVYNKNNYSTGQKFNQFDIYLNLFYNF